MLEIKTPHVKLTGQWIDIDAEGRLVLPTDVLRQAGLKPEGRVYIAVTEDGLELISQAAALRRVHEITEKFRVNGVSAVDQFISDRRKEWGEA